MKIKGNKYEITWKTTRKLCGDASLICSLYIPLLEMKNTLSCIWRGNTTADILATTFGCITEGNNEISTGIFHIGRMGNGI